MSDCQLPSVVPRPESRLWGCLSRRARWGLSPRGCILISVLGLLLVAVAMLGLHPFLAATSRVETRILVVEGWVHQYAIRAAVQEFETGNYQGTFTTGGPVTGDGGYTGDANTSASVGQTAPGSAGAAVSKRTAIIAQRCPGFSRT